MAITTYPLPLPGLRHLQKLGSCWLAILLILTALLISGNLFSQTAENPQQGSNGSAVAPHAVTFQNGNLHSGNAHFLEGHSIPYQLVMTGLTPGNQYVLKIGMDALEGGAAAIDYVTSINNLTPHEYFGHLVETINPLEGTGFTEASFGANIVNAPLPPPAHSPPALGVGAFFGGGSWVNLAAAKKSITVFGASAVGAITYDAALFSPALIGTGVTRPIYLIIPFTAGSVNAVVVWGGHIASQLDYGLNTTAATEINGAPYHSRRSGFTNGDGSVIYGNEGADRSVQIDAIIVCVVTPGSIGGAQSLCTGGDPSVLTNVQSGTAIGTLTYQWQSNTTGCNALFTDIPGATGPTYDPPAGITTTTWYQRIAFNDGDCSDTSNCIEVTVVQNPVALVLTGSSICASAPNTGTVTSSTSVVGVNYQLKRCSDNGNVQAAKAGTGAGLTWTGLAAGCYYVTGTGANPPNCSSNSNQVNVTEVANPIALVLTGSSICASDPNTGTVTSSTSQVGVTYQLKRCSDNANVQAAKAGTGAGLTWTGLATGCYYAVGTGAAPTLCTSTSNQVNVSEVANPIALVLTGSTICASNPNTGTVTSSTSQVGVTYQLKRCSDNANVQAAKAGTGAGLTWTGLATGCYYAVGTGAAPTLCTSTSNQVNVTEVANPTPLVLTGSAICASAPNTGTVTSSTSQAGVSYQLKRCSDNADVQAPKVGTGAGLTWTALPVGCYYAVGSSGTTTICSSTSNQASVTEVANPIALVLTGSSICASAPNTGTVTSSTSQVGVTYQLKRCSDNANVQAAKAGTGAGLTWTGLATGCYYAVGTGAAPTLCTSTSNQVNVSEVANPIALVLTGSSICASAPNTGTVTSSTSQVGVTYQLKRCSDNANVQAAKAGTGAGLTWTGLATGCYYAVGTGAAPTLCTSTSNQVNVSEVANPIALVLTGSSICASAPNTGTVTSSTSQVGVTYQLKRCSDNANVQAAKAGTGAGLTWTGLATGCYYAVGTGAAPTLCTSTSNQVNVSEVANPIALVLTGSAICPSNPNTGTVTSSTSQVGVTYQLKRCSDNANVQAAKAGTGAGLTWTALPVGCYYAVGTGAAPTLCTSTSNQVNVTEAAVPVALVLTGSLICDNAPNTGTITSTTSVVGVNYQLKKASDNSNVQAAKPGTGAGLTWTGLAVGSYYVTGTFAAPPNCSSNSNTVEVAVRACGNQICTYTQGAYGSTGGMMCNGQPGPGQNQFNTFETITNAINSYSINSYTPPLSGIAPFVDDVLVIGKPGHSVYANSTQAHVDAVIEHLPGGGQSKELLAADYAINALPSDYLKNNRINNTLLAQTLTLGLNLGIGPNLGNFVLQGGTLVTANPVECGSNVALVRECIYSTDAPYPLLTVLNDYHYHDISAAVVNAIPTNPKNVWGLFELANRALANQDGVTGSEHGVSLGAIAEAVDQINNAFDECRLFIGWNVAPCPPNDPTPGSLDLPGAMPINTDPTLVTELTATAFPNPFTDKVRFVVDAPAAGQLSLEVYNSLGQRVATVYRGHILAGKGQVFEQNLSSVGDNMLYYVLRLNGQQVTGKLLQIKR